MNSLLYFGPVERKMSIEDWKGNQADGAPPGTYETNMTARFRGMWKAKIVGAKSGHFLIEIRRIIRGTNLAMTVYGKSYVGLADEEHQRSWKDVDPTLEGGCTTISMNGRLTLTFEDLLELSLVVNEARDWIERLEGSDKVQQRNIIAKLEAMAPPAISP